MKDLRNAELERLYTALSCEVEGSEKYDRIQDQILKFERQDNEETKVENQFMTDSSRQYISENQAKNDKIRFWVGTGLSVLTIGTTLFATDTRIACREIPNMLKHVRFK